MCGIFGFVSGRERDAGVVLEGLRYLEYRGYDSWGIAVAEGRNAICDKAIGKIEGAVTTLPPSRAALGHTRWATHGGVTQANAHPHVDCGGRFALIHNGIVENYLELGARLRPGHRFLSQTDTEVLVHVLEEELERTPDLLTAVLQMFRQVEGLSAVAVLDAETGQIAAAKNGSPLALGWADDGCFLASDALALLPHTDKVTFLEDNQAALLSPDGMGIVSVATGLPLKPEVRVVSAGRVDAGLNGYANFMAKEIHEQPRVLREIAQAKRAEVQALAEEVRRAKDVYMIGCGTAYHAALSGRYLLSELAGVYVSAVMASEMALIAPTLTPESLVIGLSQSGETIDVLEAVGQARERGAKVAAIVNAEGSALHRQADLTVTLGCGPERCVLATKSYTAKLAVLYLLAHALNGDSEEAERELALEAHRLEELLAREAGAGTLRETAREVADHQHLFVLGRHRNYPQALEAALKIKEVSYLHAEGFASGELKHGVIALITNGTPCVILAPDSDYRREALAAAAEVRARGAFTIGVSPRAEHEFDVTVPVSESPLAAIEAAVACQMLAYELALLRGCDPDRPRNLAKSVTVK